MEAGAVGIRMRRTVKDSVFCDLFSRPEYVLELYRALHPEDAEATVADVDVVTIQTVITSDEHNDLGFTVGDRLLVLVEAQSTWSPNVALRALLYAAHTLRSWVREHGCDLYGTTPVAVPRPELYVVYTGPRREVPEVLTLSGALWEGQSSDVEVSVRVLRGGGDDIVGQYVAFAGIADGCRRLLGLTEEAARETVHACLEQGVLAEYMAGREEEVVSIMFMLYDAEEVQRVHMESERRIAAEEGRAAGLEVGLAEGRAEARGAFLDRAADAVRRGVLTLQDAVTTFGFTETEISARL